MTAHIHRRIAAGLLTCLLPLVCAAQTSDGDWQWSATLYGWFPTISGQTSFPVAGGGPSIDVNPDTLLKSLKFGFMGTLQVEKGDWGVWTDVLYMDLGDMKSGARDFTVGHRPIPADINGSLDYNIKSWIWTLAGTYSLVKTPEYSAQALVGTRMLDAKQSLGWDLAGNVGSVGLPGRSGSSEVSLTNWDAIVGVKGRANFGDERKWFLPYYLDVGTGQSKFTWQGVLGIGYEFSWGSVLGVWRYLDYEFDSGSPIDHISFNGPAIGVNFRW
jgi:hypothetical protein